jgi:hypothetical protein
MYVFHASQIEIAWQRDGGTNKPRIMLSTTSTVPERLCCFEILFRPCKTDNCRGGEGGGGGGGEWGLNFKKKEGLSESA